MSMDPTSISLVAAVVAFAASTTLKLIADPPVKPERLKACGKAVLYGFLGSLLGHAAATSFMAVQTLKRVDSLLGRETPYDRAAQFVEALPEQEKRDLFATGLRAIDHRLDLIRTGLLLVDRDEVFNTWETLFSSAKHEVLATNLVAEGDWEFFGPGGDGRRIQRAGLLLAHVPRSEAMSRGPLRLG